MEGEINYNYKNSVKTVCQDPKWLYTEYVNING